MFTNVNLAAPAGALAFLGAGFLGTRRRDFTWACEKHAKFGMWKDGQVNISGHRGRAGATTRFFETQVEPARETS